MRDLAPDHEQHWFEIYGKVALTGEPARFMAPAAALGRYYDVSAFRVGGRESRQVGILFNDISDRHRAEEERQHLLRVAGPGRGAADSKRGAARPRRGAPGRYDEELASRAALLRENELRAGLNAIGELLHSTLEPDEVMRRALGEATRALAIDAAAIELREGDTWPVRFAEGLPAGTLGSPLTGQPVIARLVAHSGEALVLDDAAGHETVGPFAARHGIRSLVAVPLVAREEINGVLLLVERRTVRHFEVAEIDFARRLGTIAGLALDNARLYEAEIEAQGRLQQELARTALLNAVAVAATASVSVAEVARRVFETMAAGLSVKVGTVFSYDPQVGRLVLLASYGVESPYLERVEEVAVDADSPMLISRAVIEGHIVSSHETPLTEARRTMLRETGVSEHNTDIAIPILAGDSAIGVLYFAFDRGETFTQDELVVFRSLAGVIGQALENARLFEAQRNIAQTLQESFIHPLPLVAGLELGVVAKTAHEPELVGGDFGDVFMVDDTHVVVLIGDVAGKGVRAASLTETVRSKIRAFATIDPSPAFILGKTNELLLRFDPDDPHVTAFCAVLDPHTGHLSYASAGHPAPVHLGAFSCRPLEVTSDHRWALSTAPTTTPMPFSPSRITSFSIPTASPRLGATASCSASSACSRSSRACEDAPRRKSQTAYAMPHLSSLAGFATTCRWSSCGWTERLGDPSGVGKRPTRMPTKCRQDAHSTVEHCRTRLDLAPVGLRCRHLTDQTPGRRIDTLGHAQIPFSSSNT